MGTPRATAGDERATPPATPTVPPPTQQGARSAHAVATLGQLALAALTAGFVTVLAQFVARGLNRLPPAVIQSPTVSTVPAALTTLALVAALVPVVLAYLVCRSPRRHRFGPVLSWAALAGVLTTELAVPLARTPLYLQGVSVDQAFRVQYLTRLTDSARLSDLNYADIAPFYPAGWFWIGGRVGQVLGLAGWEVYKPYAIGSVAVAAALALVLWSKLVRADRTLLVVLASSVVALTVGSPEPYGMVVALLLPPVLVLAWLGLRAPRGRGTPTLLGVGVFLGLAADFYTLYFAIAVLTIVIMAGLAAWSERSGRVLMRLVPTALIAGALASLAWLPFVVAVLRGAPSSGAAQRYLPDGGTLLPLPMAEVSLVGGLCLVGTGWLVLRVRTSPIAQALGIGVLTIYGWSLLSLLVLLNGTTLLAYRLEVPLRVLLVAAGALGLLEVVSAVRSATHVPVAVVVVVVGSSALAFIQIVPTTLRNEIAVAYTDPNASGVRADGVPAGDAAFYPQLVAAIDKRSVGPRDQTVLLSTDHSLLSFYPYRGFQQSTAHYANPLAQYDERAAAIRSWSLAQNPQQLLAELRTSPWRPPTAFVLRTAEGGKALTVSLSADVYPRSPNVRSYEVRFDRTLFDDPAFTVTEVGPFTVVSVAL